MIFFVFLSSILLLLQTGDVEGDMEVETRSIDNSNNSAINGNDLNNRSRWLLVLIIRLAFNQK